MHNGSRALSVESERDEATTPVSMSMRQRPVRLRSATKRMLGLSLSDGGVGVVRASSGREKSAGGSSRRTSARTGSARSRHQQQQRCLSATSTVSSDSDLQPALMPSIFPQVPPTVNFVAAGEKSE